MTERIARWPGRPPSRVALCGSDRSALIFCFFFIKEKEGARPLTTTRPSEEQYRSVSHQAVLFPAQPRTDNPHKNRTFTGMSSYSPGHCNISGAQLLKRKRFAAKCLGLTVWAILLIEIIDLSKWWKLPMVVLFTLSAIGIQQVYFNFCYVFGLKGLYGLDEVGKTKTVEEEEYRRADRAKAQRMIISSVLIGILLTAIYFFLPV